MKATVDNHKKLIKGTANLQSPQVNLGEKFLEAQENYLVSKHNNNSQEKEIDEINKKIKNNEIIRNSVDNKYEQIAMPISAAVSQSSGSKITPSVAVKGIFKPNSVKGQVKPGKNIVSQEHHVSEKKVALIPSEIIKKAHLNNIKKKQKQLNIDNNAVKIASKNQVMTP